MKHYFFKGALALAVCLSSGAALAAPLSYDLDPFTFDVSGSTGGIFDGVYDINGTIVTDGTLGSLAVASVLSGTAIAVRQGDGTSFSVTSDSAAPGAVTLTGVDVIATATQIILDFHAGGEILFSDGANSFGFRQGSIIAFANIPLFGIATSTQFSDLNRAAIANVPAPVPLPPALALMAAGLGALGLSRRRQAATG
jgi:hypothetical protein